MGAGTERQLSRAQRARLHRLADLGGLVTLAGLDAYPPDLLLGVLTEVAASVTRLPQSRLESLRQRGRVRLESRAAEKRAWKTWYRAQHLHRLDLTTAEICHTITRLGGRAPAERAAALAQLLTMIRQESTCGTPATS